MQSWFLVANVLFFHLLRSQIHVLVRQVGQVGGRRRFAHGVLRTRDDDSGPRVVVGKVPIELVLVPPIWNPAPPFKTLVTSLPVSVLPVAATPSTTTPRWSHTLTVGP
jgi:hypothetical protein